MKIIQIVTSRDGQVLGLGDDSILYRFNYETKKWEITGKEKSDDKLKDKDK